MASEYDHLLVLGGGALTAEARHRFSAGLLSSGVRVRTVNSLGSLRELPSSAVGKATADGSVSTEGDVMFEAAWKFFPSTAEATIRAGATAEGNGWWVKSYPAKAAAGPELWVFTLAAPPTRPHQRANTADTLVGWAELVTTPGPAERVLVITTDLYVPFQHAEAVLALGLPNRCGVETIGFDTRTFPGWTKGPSHVGEQLQELRSAILSTGRLYRQLALASATASQSG